MVQSTGLPHSEIRGSKVICTSPQLIAAYHVLHRLSEPRHPPYALLFLLPFLYQDYPPSLPSTQALRDGTLVTDVPGSSMMSMYLSGPMPRVEQNAVSVSPSPCPFIIQVSQAPAAVSCGTFQGLLQKGGVPAAPSGTATLLRLSPSHPFHP